MYARPGNNSNNFLFECQCTMAFFLVANGHMFVANTLAPTFELPTIVKSAIASALVFQLHFLRPALTHSYMNYERSANLVLCRSSHSASLFALESIKYTFTEIHRRLITIAIHVHSGLICFVQFLIMIKS